MAIKKSVKLGNMKHNATLDVELDVRLKDGQVKLNGEPIKGHVAESLLQFGLEQRFSNAANTAGKDGRKVTVERLNRLLAAIQRGELKAAGRIDPALKMAINQLAAKLKAEGVEDAASVARRAVLDGDGPAEIVKRAEAAIKAAETFLAAF